MGIFDAAALGVAYFTRRKPVTDRADVPIERHLKTT
jgi:hypothetical protein